MPQAHRTLGQPLTGKLRAVHPQAVRLLALAFDARGQSLLHNAVGDAEISSAEPAAGAPVYRVRMACGAGPIEGLLSGHADPAWAMAAGRGLDEGMRRLAAQVLLGTLAEQLRQWGITGIDCTGIEQHSPSPQAAHALGWVSCRRDDALSWAFTLDQMPDAAFHALKRTIAEAPHPAACRLPLALPATVTLSTRTIALTTLQTLRIGDVVVMPCEYGASEHKATAHWGARRGRRLWAQCRLNNLSLTIEGVPQMIDDTDTTAEAGAEDAVNNLDELDIPVRFEVETVAVPLADLQAIRPGYVIELAAPLDAASIRLVAYGQTIGHAELVAVGNRLGARITHMVSRNEPRTAVV